MTIEFSPEKNQKVSTSGDGGLDGSSFGTSVAAREVTMADLDWSGAVPVRPIGFRFIVPVPNLGAENEVIQVKTWDGKDKTVNGFAFRNLSDSALQAVPGDGTGVLIIGVDAEKVDGSAFARSLHAAIEASGGVASLNKAKLTDLIAQVPQLLAENALNPAVLPKTDIYDSNDAIAASMIPQNGLVREGARPFGYFEKADKPGPAAIFVTGRASVLDGPHAGTAEYADGFLAVRIPPKKDGQSPSFRSVAPDAISYCYKLESGGPIKTEDLPRA
jgi:hypothetical protein